MNSMRAKNLISDLVLPLKPSDPGSLALSWMEDLGVTHLPMVENKTLLGLVKGSDIYSLDNMDQELGKHKLPLIHTYVFSRQHLYDVLKHAATQNISVVPVVDSKNRYIGSITQADLVNAMAEFSSASQPGGILVLEMTSQQYALSEIARIVESNDAKVLSSAITSPPESTKMEVTIKVSAMDLSAIIQTFNRYDYIITASFSKEGGYDDLIRDRYDSLMKFLNT